MALNVLTGLWRLLDEANAEVIEFYNNSGVVLPEGTLVTHSGGTLAIVDDANTVGAVGVVVRGSVAIGAQGALCTRGTFEVGVNGSIDFAPLDRLYTYTGGLVDEGTAGDRAVGIVSPYTDPASGATKIKAYLWSLLHFDAITAKS